MYKRGFTLYSRRWKSNRIQGFTAYKREVLHMNNNTTVYIGMDVHHGSFTLCSLAEGEETPKNVQTIPADYLLVVKYINNLRKHYPEGTEFICGYEAGCLGYSLYHDLTNCGVVCVILAPSTMAIEGGNRRIRTDK